MSVAWPQVLLGEVLKLNLDRVPIDASATYEMVGVYSFGRGLFDREPVNGNNTSYKQFYRLAADHIVMSQLFGWEGALAISSDDFAGKYVSPQFPTFKVVSGVLDRKFLGWCMRQPIFGKDLGSRTKGMGDRRRTLNPDALFATKIPFPPFDEQQRIVARIEELAVKIDEASGLRRQALEEAEFLCRSLVFGDKKSVLTPMHQLVRQRGHAVSVKADEIYHFAGVYCFGRGVFRGQIKSGMDFAYKQLGQLKTGNFVYPKLMAWEGAFGVVPQECDGLFVSPEFPIFEVIENRVLPETLDVYFRTPAVWPLVAGESTGTNVRRRRLNPKDFLSYSIPLPSMQNQLRLRKVMQHVDALKRIQVETKAELDAMLPSILDKAFKGGFQ